MLLREARKRPNSWQEYSEAIRPRWLLGFHTVEWLLQWAAYFLSRWAFLEVLECLGILSVLVALIFYFAESGDRKKQKHYAAWQVINTASGKGGSGGRIEALMELNLDGVPLVGADAAGAFLQGVKLPRANLLRCNLEAADLRDSDLSASNLEDANLKSANLRRANLYHANLKGANLEAADLASAELRDADLTGARLLDADLHNADLKGAHWSKLGPIERANIYGVRNSPEGFIAWALEHKAVSVRPDE